MSKLQRVFSWLLCLAMMAALLPLPLAEAASTSVYNGKTYSTDYTTWRQADKAWGSTALGDQYTLTSSGCLVSSIAILMCHSGAYDPARLNPGSLRDWFDAKKMISHSTDAKKDGRLSYGMMTSSVSPRFYYVGQEQFAASTPLSDVCAKISGYHSKGYQVVARVKSGGHFAAVASATDSDAKLYDPGAGAKSNLSAYQGTITGLLYFKANTAGKDGILPQSTPPGVPAVNKLSPVYGTGDRVVVSWKAAERATHYTIYVDMQKANGAWQSNYKKYTYASSPSRLEALPAGTYRLRVEAGNINTSPVTYATSANQTFTVQANALTIVYDPGGGSVSPASKLVKPYSAFDLPTPTRNGYAFTGWYAPAGNLISRTSKVGSVGVTLTARWASGGVGFRKQTSYQDQFRDVAKRSWYYDSVASVYNYGLMSGITTTDFGPGDNVTAAQAITMAARMRKLYATGSGAFSASTPWYKSYLDYAQSQKILTSVPANMNMALTRQEFASILANALPDAALPAVNQITNGALPDVYRSDTGVYKLYRAGILTGNDSRGTFLPNAPITRAEAAAILVRMADPNSRMLFTLA